MTLVLDDLSAQAVADDEPELAARLWGAGRALTKATGATIAQFTDEWFEAALRPSVRTSVGADDLKRWAAEGAAMSLDDAVAFALGLTKEELATLADTHVD
jgi:hypothetical protein